MAASKVNMKIFSQRMCTRFYTVLEASLNPGLAGAVAVTSARRKLTAHVGGADRNRKTEMAAGGLVDFVSDLPPEVVEAILSHAETDDSVRCLKVCKSWREKVGDLNSYWRKALKEIGIPGYVITKHTQKGCCTHLQLFLTVKKQRESFAKYAGKYFRLQRPESYYHGDSELPSSDSEESTDPDDFYKLLPLPSHTFDAGNQYVVEVTYQLEGGPIFISRFTTPDFKQHSKAVFVGKLNGTSVKKVCELPVKHEFFGWAQIPLHGKWVVLTDAGITWFKCPLSIEPTAQETSVVESFSVIRENTFSDTSFASCSKCPLIVQATGGAIPNTYWEINIIKIQEDSNRVEKITLPLNQSDRAIVTQHAALISFPDDACMTPSGFCHSHRLLLQYGETVTVYKLVMQSGDDPTKSELITELQACGAQDDTKEKNFCISADQELLGIAQKLTLHVWNLVTYSKQCTVPIDVQFSGNPATPTVFALGHVYSIIGYDSDFAVISTHTGEILWRYSNFMKEVSCQFSPFSPMSVIQPEGVFLRTVREDWLSDIHVTCPPLEPFMLFNNVGEAAQGKLAIDGVAFD